MSEKLIFLTTSHNQQEQVNALHDCLSVVFSSEFHLICVESGEVDESRIPEFRFTLVRTHSESFWAESNARGLDFIFSNFPTPHFHLVILNCDVRLSDWNVLTQVSHGIHSFFTVRDGIIERSGYSISNWFLGIHRYSRLGERYTECGVDDEVEIVPTRLILVCSTEVEKIRGIRPRYRRLPHYGADFVFTHEISCVLGAKWRLSPKAYLVETLPLQAQKQAKVRSFARPICCSTKGRYLG